MSSRIAIGVIEADGSLETVVAWANPLSNVIKNEKFAGGDTADLTAYLDYYRADPDGDGFGTSANVPSEGGYILVDKRNMTIVDANHVLTVDILLSVELTNYIRRPVLDQDELDGKARMVTHVLRYGDGDVAEVPVGPFRTAEEALAHPLCRRSDPFMQPQLKIGYPAWTLDIGTQNAERLAVVRDYLISHAALSADEIQNWDSVIRKQGRSYDDGDEDAETPATPGMR